MSVMWTAKKDFYQRCALGAHEIDGVPVFVAEACTYPEWVSDAGESDRDVPHIMIWLSGDQGEYKHASLTAMGTWRGSRRRTLAGPAVMMAEAVGADELLAVALQRVPEAIEVLRGMDALYDQAEALIERAWAYTDPLDRAAYEAACAHLDVRVLSDAEVDNYGVRYGAPEYPLYPAEEVVAMYLARRRLSAVDATREEGRRAGTSLRPDDLPPQPQGQLWEPCERCGAEPSYMPLHRCKKCWPK